MTSELSRMYWDSAADVYQGQTHISCTDFHYGPLLPGDAELSLLPRDLSDLDCLELGCGAAQNSIYLASQGGRCTAVDVSAEQLAHAARLAAEAGVAVDLVQADMQCLPFPSQGRFDLVHSTYALPFLENQREAVLQAAGLLRRGGTFLLTTAHPLATAEWLEVDDGEVGVFLQDYFHPCTDSRKDEGAGEAVCRPATLSTLFGWFTAAGLIVSRLLEPQPLPVTSFSESELEEQLPYFSEAWLERYPELACVPFVVVVVARKPV